MDEAPESLCVSENEDDKRRHLKFYEKAQKYWSNVPATVNGMLGGLGYVNPIDIQCSYNFLRDLKVPGNQCALDCGAGIGRVSRNVLFPFFSKVDLVEQNATFLEKARELCKSDGLYHNRLGEFYNAGLQEFKPLRKYDLVWSQWVLGHLTNADLVAFFRRICSSLVKDGYFVIKENVSDTKKIIPDRNDSSVTRPIRLYKRFLKEAGFSIVRKVRQSNFPEHFLPVFIIACRPIVYVSD